MDWDQKVVLSCSWDSYVHLYVAWPQTFACVAKDLRSEQLVHRFEGHNSNCYALDVDFERNLAVSAANDYHFIEWDLRQVRAPRCIFLRAEAKDLGNS